MKLPQSIRDVADKATCLHSQADIEAALDKMAAEITEKLSDKNPLILCVMVGGIIPVGNLLTRLDFPLELNYVHASRYNSSTTGGDLQWKAKPLFDVKDRTVLIVDDILDAGLTLNGIKNYCIENGAADTLTAVLVDKECPRDPGGVQSADFTGLQVENVYVYGYGLDYHEYLRNAPGIYAVAPEHQ